MLAPIAPLVVLPAGAAMVITLGGEGGLVTNAWSIVGLALTAAATVATSTMLLLVARGRDVPGPILVAVSALPWLLGSVGARVVVAIEPEVQEHVSPVLAPFATAVALRTLGSVLGAALLSMSALGLALAARALRAPGRRALGAAIGLAAGLTLVGAAIAAAASGEAPSGVPFVAALVAVPALALAGASVGTDGRSGALATTAGALASLSVLAGAGADGAMVRIQAFGAMAHAAPDTDRAVLYSASIEAGAAHTTLAYGGIVMTLIATAIIIAWTVARARPTRAHVARAALVLLVAGALVVPSAGALRPADARLIGALRARPPRWPGVTLARTSASAAVPEGLLEILVTEEGITIDGSRVDDAATRLQQHGDRLRLIAERVPARPFTGELLVATDGGVRYGTLVGLLRAARRAGFVAPVLVVEGRDGAPAALAMSPAPDPLPDDAGIRIAIDTTGVSVTVPGDARARPIDARDDAALERLLERARSDGAGETTVLVHAPPDISWADVASHVAVVHRHFPSIVLDHDGAG